MTEPKRTITVEAMCHLELTFPSKVVESTDPRLHREVNLVLDTILALGSQGLLDAQKHNVTLVNLQNLRYQEAIEIESPHRVRQCALLGALIEGEPLNFRQLAKKLDLPPLDLVHRSDDLALPPWLHALQALINEGRVVQLSDGRYQLTEVT